MMSKVYMYSVRRRFLRFSMNGCLAAMFLLVFNVPETLAKPFESDRKAQLVTELEQQQAEAHNWSQFNQAWDLSFKIALLLLGILSAVGAGLAGTIWKNSAPSWLTIGNIVVGAAITGLTAFAFSQLNFPARAELYRKKETALHTMLMELRYLNPDDSKFLTALEEVYSWHDATPSDVQIPQDVLSHFENIPSQQLGSSHP